MAFMGLPFQSVKTFGRPERTFIQIGEAIFTFAAQKKNRQNARTLSQLE
jgi:hypothetical protein